ncbi:hypothetical protein [Dehalobacter sp. 4CP]|uniref:hypothetical protein n=1 Tax=Dehalobacter sp. CP TaxID=2594474 RepID=UPI0039EA0DDB
MAYIKREAATDLMILLKQHGLLKPIKDSAFQKVEKLLYQYNQFKKAIEVKQEQIQDIRDEGLPERSKSIVIFSGNHNSETSTNIERAEVIIEKIESSIEKIESYIYFIDKALEKISMDEYFELIELKYFEDKTMEYIAEYFDVDVKTIRNNKKRLINSLKVYLFPDETFIELIG